MGEQDPEVQGVVSRRRVIKALAVTCGGVALAGVSYPLLASMGPTADADLVPLEIDLRGWEPGTARSFQWTTVERYVNGALDPFMPARLAMVLRRTPGMIAAARKLDERERFVTDASRVKKAEWVVVTPVCTHLGCAVRWGRDRYTKEDQWVCDCHSSYFDSSGRRTSGPALRDLDIPPYYFADEDTLILGADAPGHTYPRPPR